MPFTCRIIYRCSDPNQVLFWDSLGHSADQLFILYWFNIELRINQSHNFLKKIHDWEIEIIFQAHNFSELVGIFPDTVSVTRWHNAYPEDIGHKRSLLSSIHDFHNSF